MTIVGSTAQQIMVQKALRSWFLVIGGATSIMVDGESHSLQFTRPLSRPFPSQFKPGDISRHSCARHRPRCLSATFRRSPAGGGCLSDGVIVCIVEHPSENTQASEFYVSSHVAVPATSS
jgi:hypothetical protein